MLVPTEYLTNSTDSSPSPDAFSEVLSALRVSGRLLINEAYVAPWGVAVPGQEGLRRLLATTENERLVPFHLVRRGAFELHRVGRKPLLVRAGEGVFLPAGTEHRLVEGRDVDAVPLERLLQTRRRRDEEPADATSLICGVFVVHDVRFNPLFGALPDVLRVTFDGPTAGQFLRGITALLAGELGDGGARRPWVVDRLLDLLFAEGVTQSSDPRVTWLTAARDPAIGAALSTFHRAPAKPWTVRALAKQAHLSPSRFAVRFRELVGASPMSYVASWRLVCAARELRDSAERVEVIGRAWGYESLPVFSRAFKRQWGTSPLGLRREMGRMGRMVASSRKGAP